MCVFSFLSFNIIIFFEDFFLEDMYRYVESAVIDVYQLEMF